MERLSKTARGVYRDVVYEDPRFIEYFRTATPEVELGTLPIGSRPTRRVADGGVDSLRAIPWVFAWTQTRLLLPSWLGTGEALVSAHERGEQALLREMYAGWPFFRSTLDLIAMVLAESDARIAAEYDRRLVPDRPARRRRRPAPSPRRDDCVGAGTPRARNVCSRKTRCCGDRSRCATLTSYPINLVQIELLRRLREDGEADRSRRFPRRSW